MILSNNTKQIILVVNLKKSKLFKIFKFIFLLIPSVFIILIFTLLLNSLSNSILFIVCILQFLIWHFYDDFLPLTVRKIICYDEYFEIIDIFRTRKIHYADLDHYSFWYSKIIHYRYKKLSLYYNYAKLSTCINCLIFESSDLEKFFALLNSKGIYKKDIFDIIIK